MSELQTDGTRQLRQDPSFSRYLELLNSTLPCVSGVHGWVDEYTAAQLGLALILGSVRWQSVDLMALVQRGRVEASRVLEIEKVYLDFPDADVTYPPAIFAVVGEGSEATYTATQAMTGVDIDDDTLHVWGHNTVLRRHGRAETEFLVQVYTGNKDDRAALRKRLVEVLASEPDSDRTARRVVLPFYFDQPVRYTLQSISYPDDGEQAQANRWPMLVRVRAELCHVTLVEAPPALRVPAPVAQVDA